MSSEALRMRESTRRWSAALAVSLTAACMVDWRDGRHATDPAVRACAACHASQAEAFLSSSRHRGGGAGALGCETCHVPHSLDTSGAIASEAPPRSCCDCHAEVQLEFHLPFQHGVGRGVDTERCIACHDPHGGPRLEERETERHERCLECHVEFAGPFLYPHEGNHRLACLSCHEPHGSTNRRLLTHATPRELCFSCHAQLEIIHDQSPGSRFRECLACHTEVHGSNWDRLLTR
ncbi:MAG: hypothetical protein IT453_17390 [Planctomycetes bacterium]|nr:hypothetical protein [Planctomycetota bacterium]